MGKIKYEHKTWYDKSDTENAAKRIPLSAANLNRIEDGIQESFDELAYANLKNLVIQKITLSSTWTAPKAVRNMFKVFCVGGGGGGGNYYYYNDDNHASGGGGGGGYISVAELSIPSGTTIDVVCGSGGSLTTDGGTSYFGELLMASGGKAGENGTNSGYVMYGGKGGDGGAGGGGGGIYVETSSGTMGSGGDGEIFGGGGASGGAFDPYAKRVQDSIVGKGGKASGFGGDGGGSDTIAKTGQVGTVSFIDCLFGIEHIIDIKTPLNTNHCGSGGINCNGGFGSCGGSGDSSISFGGGGGYCGNGGNHNGGGGGYCGNGGNGGIYSGTYHVNSGGGGGGGFFCNGGTPTAGSSSHYRSFSVGGGGGGFFCDGTSSGVGGDGGVLIMYIKDDSQEE